MWRRLMKDRAPTRVTDGLFARRESSAPDQILHNQPLAGRSVESVGAADKSVCATSLYSSSTFSI